MDPRAQKSLLETIVKARRWMDEITSGKVHSFEEIAAREHLVERYVRRLSSLGFLSPKIVQAIIDGTAPADLTATSLTRALPHSWSAQEMLSALQG
jgi:hypothetical protein